MRDFRPTSDCYMWEIIQETHTHGRTTPVRNCMWYIKPCYCISDDNLEWA